MSCSGREERLSSASCMANFGWGDFRDICTHGQDVGVDCDDPNDGGGSNVMPPTNTGIGRADGYYNGSLCLKASREYL